MISPLAERYKVPFQSIAGLAVAGVILTGIGGWLAWWCLHFGVEQAFMLSGAALGLVSGAACIGTAILRMRLEVILAPDGVRFSETGAVHPWNSIGEVRAHAIGDGFDILDRSGTKIGAVPDSLADSTRIYLLLLRVIAPLGGSGGIDRKGGHGWRPILFPLLLLAALISKWSAHDVPLDFKHWFLPATLIGVGFVLETRVYRSRIGTAYLEIDPAGIRFRRGRQAWELRWTEIVRLIPLVHGPKTGDWGALLIDARVGEGHSVPLKGFDLLAIVRAARTFAPQVMERSFLPPDPLPAWFDRAIGFSTNTPLPAPQGVE